MIISQTFIQAAPAFDWVVSHNFENTPVCEATVLFEGKTQVILPKSIRSTSGTQIIVSFSTPIAGKLRMIGNSLTAKTSGVSGVGSVDLSANAPGITASFTSSPEDTVGSGSPATFTSTSIPGPGAGRVITTYAWTITDGGSSAAFVGADDESSAVVNTTSAGTYTIGLEVTSDIGKTSTTSKVMSVF